MHDKNKKHLLNGYFSWQCYQEPYLEPSQKSIVELFCKNSFLQKSCSINVKLCCL